MFVALNSAAINLAECDHDLMGVPAAGAGGVAVGDAAAEEEEEGEAALPGL
jgi:hypothetical protein